MKNRKSSRREVSLFSPRAVAVAALLATPLAGAILLAMNEQQLENRQGVTNMVAMGVVTTFAVLLTAMALPQLPSAVFMVANIALGVSLRKLAEQRLAQATGDRHLTIRTGSSGEAVAVAVGSMLVVLVAGVGMQALAESIRLSP